MIGVKCALCVGRKETYFLRTTNVTELVVVGPDILVVKLAMVKCVYSKQNIQTSPKNESIYSVGLGLAKVLFYFLDDIVCVHQFCNILGLEVEKNEKKVGLL